MNGEKKEGKEYNYYCKSVYEEGYLNGKRHGKGKLFDTEYANEKIKYEGEFLNGKKNGKGIEYSDCYHRKYEGEYLNGKKNGKGKEYTCGYSEDFRLEFEGDYINNYRKKGKEYYKNGKLKFEGEYLFEEKWNGKIYDNNENIINGNAKIEDSRDKITIYIYENLDRKKLKENAKGKNDYKRRLLFEGEYLGGEK